ncbi:GntR family transcriptional regulator [Prosthecodimorpha staleyi]|uniref:GntR family transcriptional regulator n=1 Tax=Prosthecodimorpha staleyi TaxID=2840188 RepID=A0A947GG54_9HYPH|nr:GntR family transcriptional regulator [Prosthecodimorpha staleyi]MBT9291530.1 GntR family transcriptional regulator [Prosthecodimorpha staleyi]
MTLGSAAPVESIGRRDSLAEQVYADLLTRLRHGRVAPDQRLVDVELARGYGLSRMPVRDALLRLVAEGYLVGTTRGFKVPALASQDVRDIFEIRRLLEPQAAASAAGAMSDEALEALGAAHAECRRAHGTDDIDAMIVSNMAFRAAWLGRVANRRLAETIFRFVDHVQAVRLATLRHRDTRAIVVDGLGHLRAAFQARDPELAAACMGRFVDDAQAAFFRAAGVEGPHDGPAHS